jgi:hypothetical protein
VEFVSSRLFQRGFSKDKIFRKAPLALRSFYFYIHRMLHLSKMAVAPLLLSVYLLALCRPFCPLVEYTLNKAYFAQVLCENKDKPELRCEGKCHLAKEITKANDAGEKESKPASPKINFDNDYSYLNALADHADHLQNLNSLFKLTSAVPFTSEAITDIFHPPRHIFTLR